jgi:hypothetical protein
MNRYRSRPRAEEVAAEMVRASMDVRGFTCSKCGCHNFRVETTRPHNGEITRYRRCRNCNAVLTTVEVPRSGY